MKAKTLLFVIIFLGINNIIFGYNFQVAVPDGIINSLKVGNAKELAKYFNDNIELILLDKEGVYSKSQAELILKDFFTKNAVNSPNGFIKLFEGGKDSLKYIIGTLYTSKGRYRVSLFFKNINGSFIIHQLRIEDDNN
jgi:hypothetical protein